MARTKPPRSRRSKSYRPVVAKPAAPAPVPAKPKMSRPALMIRILVTLLGLGYITKIMIDTAAAQHH